MQSEGNYENKQKKDSSIDTIAFCMLFCTTAIQDSKNRSLMSETRGTRNWGKYKCLTLQYDI